MTISPKTLTGATALDRIAAALGIGGAGTSIAAVFERLVAEYLRHFACLFSRPSPGRYEPVHASRLLHRLRKHLGPFIADRPMSDDLAFDGEPEEEEPDMFRRLFDRLVVLRELQHLGQGFYLPTPPRLVRLPDVDHVLVVGGLPTRELATWLGGPSPEFLGILRVVRVSDLGAVLRDDPDRYQAWDAWLGRPAEGLTEWMDARIAEAAAQLVASPESVNPFEVYLPSRAGARTQARRWVPHDQWDGDPRKLHLCRRGGIGVPRRYWLCRLQRTGDAASPEREVTVPRERVRRLLFGFDSQAGRATKAELTRSSGRCRLTVWGPLPNAEERWLAALVSPDGGNSGGPTRIFEFADRWRGVVEDLLGGLDIAFDNAEPQR